MSKVQSMEVHINTADEFGAGTSGNVFAGVCGREFLLTRQNYDDESTSSQGEVTLFERAGFNEFIFDLDDPDFDNSIASPSLDSVNLDSTPSYIRFQPAGVRPNWKVASVSIVINTKDFDRITLSTFFPTKPNEGIYRDSITLGKDSGLYIYLAEVSRAVLRRETRMERRFKGGSNG